MKKKKGEVRKGRGGLMPMFETELRQKEEVSVIPVELPISGTK